MSDNDKRDEVARLERVNEDLSDSLRRCRKLLHDYEVRLTANSNERPADEADSEQREA